MTTNSILDVARKGLLASVGALAYTREGLAAALDRFATRGSLVEQTARLRIERSLRQTRSGLAQGQERAAEARTDLQRRRDRLYDALNIPTQTSIAELDAQVDQLTTQIDELRAALRRQAHQVPIQPLPDYDKLTVEEVLERMSKLEEPALLALRAYEQQHANRVTVLRAAERALVEQQAARGALGEPAGRTSVEPLPQYAELRAEEIVERVAGLSQTELLHVRTYEQEHQARVTVLRAIEERLAAKA
jgi:poly(hydroxyalkanoate) granule-associated protein